MAIIFVYLLGTPSTVLAAENNEILIINGEKVISYNENYENLDTGEYVRWRITTDTALRTAKAFDFKIRYSLTTTKFGMGNTSAMVYTTANIVDLAENPVSGYSGHRYTVKLTGLYSRTLSFAIGGTSSGIVTGLKEGGQYSATIINNDYLDDVHYLMGTCIIKYAS